MYANRASLIRMLMLLLIWKSSPLPLDACTTAVISGKATVDGRPLLWKNRDAPARHNEVALLTEGPLRAVAVVNAGSRRSAWMGMNEAGFCIENSLSTDLRQPGKKTGPANGLLIKRALLTCRTVADFKRLLEDTNQSGRRTVANFGVIDA
ncbi:MAG: peptidase C45, partial [Planctomycetaceae bacterium]|nr:peptidase C45 [Planctomycetaceae bacterium]